ncbi:MAG TPA: cyclase family protein [Chthoniobacteraceae bacterium]|jgi:kynurenine formamidase|nr:cyclase family protein [Chthoniobacteraceae bacterium]
MKLIDLSQPIFDGAPNCPAHPPVRIDLIADHPRDGWRMEMLTMASHTGSHVDAPLHKLAGGADLDALPLESFIGEAVIADLRGIAADEAISARRLADALGAPAPGRIVLLATGWGEKRAMTEEWQHRSPYLSPEAARWLVEQKARAVGIDHYSIGGSRDPDNSETHSILLGAGIWIVEELRFPPEAFALSQPFQFAALPVNFRNHSGAFCRPVAMLP